jgi:hypothetical protein
MLRLREVVTATTAHFGAYLDLAGAAAGELRRDVRRRALYGTLGAIFVLLAATFATGWGLLAIWELPNREWVAAAVLAVLTTAAWWLINRAFDRSAGGPHRTALREELSRDRELLNDWQTSRQ